MIIESQVVGRYARFQAVTGTVFVEGGLKNDLDNRENSAARQMLDGLIARTPHKHFFQVQHTGIKEIILTVPEKGFRQGFHPKLLIMKRSLADFRTGHWTFSVSSWSKNSFFTSPWSTSVGKVSIYGTCSRKEMSLGRDTATAGVTCSSRTLTSNM